MATTNLLTKLFVKSAGAGKYRDGPNLYLKVGKGRRWLFIYQWGGKSVELGLGSADRIELADARKAAQRYRDCLAKGIEPRAIRAAAKAEALHAKQATFWSIYEGLRDTKVAGLSNAKHRAQWTSSLTKYAANLRDMPVASITTNDVYASLKPIWTTKAETASRVRGRIEAVLDAAKALGLRSGENPAAWKGNLAHLLPVRRKLTRGHHKALPFEDAPNFMASLSGRQGVAARALEFTVLTAARTGETIGATWDEFDLDGGIWTIPAERMKMKVEHRVPLADAALTVLCEMKPLGEAYVFPGPKEGSHLSNAAMSAVLKRMEVDVTVHGFRSTFRDWAGEATSHPRDVIEFALAHKVGSDVERSYRRGDALEKRRSLMQDWADVLTGSKAGEG